MVMICVSYILLLIALLTFTEQFTKAGVLQTMYCSSINLGMYMVESSSSWFDLDIVLWIQQHFIL